MMMISNQGNPEEMNDYISINKIYYFYSKNKQTLLP